MLGEPSGAEGALESHRLHPQLPTDLGHPSSRSLSHPTCKMGMADCGLLVVGIFVSFRVWVDCYYNVVYERPDLKTDGGKRTIRVFSLPWERRDRER